MPLAVNGVCAYDGDGIPEKGGKGRQYSIIAKPTKLRLGDQNGEFSLLHGGMNFLKKLIFKNAEVYQVFHEYAGMIARCANQVKRNRIGAY